MMSLESSWRRRISKTGQYLAHGDLVGLLAEIRRFWTWNRSRKVVPSQPGTEAAFWDGVDVELARETAWTSAADFGFWVLKKRSNGRYSNIIELMADVIRVPRSQSLRGLVLGCGDMVGEYSLFISSRLLFAEVDAYDASPKSIDRARQLTSAKGLHVNYHVADVNRLELPSNQYALIVTHHAFHHFEQIDRVAQQINQALLPGGIFHMCDYIGPCRLQFTGRQLFYAQTMLQLLPEKYRRELDGRVRQRVQSVSPALLSPDEAIHSDRILPAVAQHMNVAWQANWAGLLYPLLEGIAFNFTARDEDQALVRFLFDLDYALCQTGQIEPNFTITLANKR